MLWLFAHARSLLVRCPFIATVERVEERTAEGPIFDIAENHGIHLSLRGFGGKKKGRKRLARKQCWSRDVVWRQDEFGKNSRLIKEEIELEEFERKGKD